MKRAEIAYIADIRPKRMDLLRERGQIPFEPPERDAFTLDHAFRLRLMLDLIGGEDDGLGGLAPSDAAPLVVEVMGRFPRHPLHQIEPFDWWAGVAILEAMQGDETRRWAVTYAGELAQFPAWLDEARTFEAGGPDRAVAMRGQHRVVRVFLVNATRAANVVRDRAEEIGIDPFAAEASQ
ncbi:hypothetical protein HUK65_06300 [Rhodobacteraceae bacterium 2376]|uniref:Uncharacterized protein n=1 Tax=Rhabdonatronobacter sediminivivens TaxID=2743469 RepID=A0A7Z0HYH6_9RHOB|nr:hypothetical protein [Rhabdonatronobacter sediminivivens]NYS24598.1 hypothetical protein [Rhabdonatronobacter sediminivivens]